MMRMSPDEYVDLHIQMQLGTYFHKDEPLVCGCKYASSSKIHDLYWNYAHGLSCGIKDLPRHMQEIRDYAARIERRPALYITPETVPPDLCNVVSPAESTSEVWMECRRDALVTPPNDRLTVKRVDSDVEFERFITLFTSAYSSGEAESVGYTGLPQAYPESLRHASPRSDVNVKHFIGYADDAPAAIASLYATQGCGGLYNVGCAHNTRRKGYASVISAAAVLTAFDGGCERVFLQTEPDSAVEVLYRKVGFSRCFVGRTLVIA
jgi:hypothetical protein